MTRREADPAEVLLPGISHRRERIVRREAEDDVVHAIADDPQQGCIRTPGRDLNPHGREANGCPFQTTLRGNALSPLPCDYTEARDEHFLVSRPVGACSGSGGTWAGHE